MNPYEVSTFEEFWPHYVRMHARPETQRLHAAATLTAAALVGAGLLRRRPLLLFLAPVADYAIAQLAHRRFEHNVTQPWRNPAWHLRAELRMLKLVMSGKMAEEVERVGGEPPA